MPHVVTPPVPDEDQLAAIRELIAEVAAADGRTPLSDQALSRLTSPSVAHALLVEDGRARGYAQLDGVELEIAAETDAVAPLLDAVSDRPLLVWSHGRTSRLTEPLRARGFLPDRELYQLRRSLADPVEAPPPPEGITIGPFRVGTDEDAWLRVNAAAFAHHPEQGRWTRTDIEARESEPWFDPSGFLLAWRGAELVGFHWTKVHPDGAGEVYVLGVDPSTQGTGLGAVLLRRGLALLRERGCPEVLLYVDGDNVAARHLYERYGFVEHDLDIQWVNPEQRSAQSTSTGSVSKT